MTLEEIRTRVEKIRATRNDDESAHMLEAELYFEFVKFISESDSPYAPLAQEVLRTQAIKFGRWYA